MNSFKKWNNLVGWLVFAITATVFYLSAERTGSLWDCGEFVSGCYKLQVVHPPGAPLFLLVGRLFTILATTFSKDPSAIAFAVNICSGLCTAFAATFICWSTIILGKLALNGRDEEPTQGQYIALAGSGFVAGLCTAFASSVWFSAVEGEVYAMSTFFTCFTLWTMMKWYNQPDTPQADRWMILAIYAAGLSMGVHLLSLLTFPALALFYYFKKTEKPTLWGMFVAGVSGVIFIGLIQTLIITGIPALWGSVEMMLVNSMGLPRIVPSLVVVLAIISAATYFGLRFAHQQQNRLIQNLVLGLALTVVSFSTVGVVMLRADANPPINMNHPSDPLSLIPYLNREQYGERPLLYGPSFTARPIDYKQSDRYGWVESTKKYEVVDQKTDYVFADDVKMPFPRMGHWESDRVNYYKYWMGMPREQQVPTDRPTFGDNLSYFFNYQVRWMYWRYFMWNFSGKLNGEQGFTPGENNGDWITGINFFDRYFLHVPTEKLPDHIKNDPARNTYFALPFLFGILGAVWHFRKRRNDMLGLLALFLITGIGIIIYTNEPPNEPRERDYVLVGSIFTFAIWIGMGVLAMLDLFINRFKLKEGVAAPLATAIISIAPFLMLTQNFDDHSRAKHTGARDYAINFLESCDKNAIIFTYGDNDTYPLWYAQEVEGIRTDVRVINLSLIEVDWYINQMRRKINNSPAIKMTVPYDSYRGIVRQQYGVQKGNPMNIQDVVKFIGESHPVSNNGQEMASYVPTNQIIVPVDRAKAIANGVISDKDTAVAQMEFTLGNSLMRGSLAVMDVIANNAMERPIYFAVTCRPEAMLGLQDYMQLEGLAVRLVPIKTQSEMRSFGVIGAGRVQTDKVYDRVMNKFKWGNFNTKEKTYINRSYTPSVQTIQFALLRTANELIRKGDKTKAVELLEKNFESFPNNNFPYSYQTMYFLGSYAEAGAMDKAKKHINILAENILQHLQYYKANAGLLKTDNGQPTALGNEQQGDMQVKDDLIRLAERGGDLQLKKELEEKFKAFPSPQAQGMPMPIQN